MIRGVFIGFITGIALCAVWVKCRFLPQNIYWQESAVKAKYECDVKLGALVHELREIVR